MNAYLKFHDFYFRLYFAPPPPPPNSKSWILLCRNTNLTEIEGERREKILNCGNDIVKIGGERREGKKLNCGEGIAEIGERGEKKS